MGKQKKHRALKHPGETYADVLARQQLLKQAVKDAARDVTVKVQADTQTQRALWLAACSIADAYGFGPKRMALFFEALQTNAEELEMMRREGGEDYAYEKLRRKAEAVSGIHIEYLYEHERLAAEIKHAKEGLSLDDE